MLKAIFGSILIFLCIFSGFVQAEDIEVCVDPYPPFKMVDRSGVVVGGIDIDLITVLVESLGFQPKYTSLPWARCLNNLKHGKTDLISGIVRNSEREKYLLYIEPPYKTKSVKIFYVNRAEDKKYQTYDDISSLTIGILRNAKHFEQLDGDNNIKKYELSDLIAGFKMLRMKRIDTLITTEEVGDYIIKSNGFSNDFRKAEFRYSQDVAVYFALSKKSKYVDKLYDFEAAVTELKQKGIFDKILADYLNSKDN